jgi:uncharacterized protein (DUF305 family)
MRFGPTTAALILVGGFAIGTLGAGLAIAQQSHGGHSGHTMAKAAGKGPAAELFDKINAEMHAAMAVEWSGDADVDFIKTMIPHHQGAVYMAQVVLDHGKDEVVRKLAQEIISAQETEIALMKAWLAKKGK